MSRYPGWARGMHDPAEETQVKVSDGGPTLVLAALQRVPLPY